MYFGKSAIRNVRRQMRQLKFYAPSWPPKAPIWRKSANFKHTAKNVSNYFLSMKFFDKSDSELMTHTPSLDSFVIVCFCWDWRRSINGMLPLKISQPSNMNLYYFRLYLALLLQFKWIISSLPSCTSLQ